METSVNNKCKAFTSLEQSRKLAEILPLESADMNWHELPSIGLFVRAFPYKHDNGATEGIFPCWSLAALLSLIRETIGYTLYGVNNVYMSCDLGDKPWKLETEVYDNEVDACVAMIEKLHEHKML